MKKKKVHVLTYTHCPHGVYKVYFSFRAVQAHPVTHATHSKEKVLRNQGLNPLWDPFYRVSIVYEMRCTVLGINTMNNSGNKRNEITQGNEMG